MTNNTSSINIAFIGAGNMASACLRGLVAAGVDPNTLWASNPSISKLETLERELGIHIHQDNHEVAKQADVVILAVKPQKIWPVATALNATLSPHQLVISFAAGVPLSQLQRCLKPATPIIRAMPNTPVAVRTGAIALFANDTVTDPQRKMANDLLKKIGITVWLDHEKDMDTVTALSGSGPAYFFLVMEALQEAAEHLGLSPRIARQLTQQTALGAAAMATHSEETLTTLKNRVISPGGTTEQAIQTLESAQVPLTLAQALKNAHQRAKALATQIPKEHPND